MHIPGNGAEICLQKKVPVKSLRKRTEETETEPQAVSAAQLKAAELQGRQAEVALKLQLMREEAAARLQREKAAAEIALARERMLRETELAGERMRLARGEAEPSAARAGGDLDK